MLLYLLVFAITLLISLTIGFSPHRRGQSSVEHRLDVQDHNKMPVQRVGGVAIALGLLTAWVLAAPEVGSILGPMLIAGIPALGFGLAEDISKRIGVLARLLATMSGGVIAWFLTGVAVQNTGIPWLDWLLTLLPVAVFFTAFAVGGLSNAINIIDGFNGLAAGAVAIMLGSIGLIALNENDGPLAYACFGVAVCALGFGAVNWPSGKLFLGDGGAYLLGFSLAWVAILLPVRNPQVSGFASLLVCAYPVLEVGFSMRRRIGRVGCHVWQPDRLHLHHLIHRRVVCRLFPGVSTTLKNSCTSPICWLFVAIPAAWAVAFARNMPMLVAAAGAMIVAYSAIYARLVRFRWSGENAYNAI